MKMLFSNLVSAFVNSSAELRVLALDQESCDLEQLSQLANNIPMMAH